MSSSFQVYYSNGERCGRFDRILRVRGGHDYTLLFSSHFPKYPVGGRCASPAAQSLLALSTALAQVPAAFALRSKATVPAFRLKRSALDVVLELTYYHCRCYRRN